MDLLDRARPRFGAGLVVFDRRARHADRADDYVVLRLDRHAAGEGDQAAVADLDHVERLARLAELADLAGRHVEVAGRPRLLLRDVDAAEPRAVHADESLEVPAGVDDGDVLLDLQL